MAFNLDATPYDWTEPAAQELLTRLSQIHPTSKAAQFLAVTAGVDAGFINWDQPVVYIWIDVLNKAFAEGLLRSLVQKQHDLMKDSSPHKAFFADLLARKQPAFGSDPRDEQGAPNFISKDDEVMELEALLYYDDLTLPIGKIPSLIVTLQKLMTYAPSVCRLVVDFNGQSGHGTGFRVGPELLLTNWHVLTNPYTAERATAVTAEFGYEDDGKGTLLPSTLIPCDLTSIITDKKDDWAVIKTTTAMPNAWPILKLGEACDPKLQEPAYIIQHPGGERKRMGFVRNQVSFFDDRVTHYLTDTQAGASGSPVWNAEGCLIALHHAGGRPQEVLGKPPVSKNEGIRISRVISGLKAAGVDVS